LILLTRLMVFQKEEKPLPDDSKETGEDRQETGEAA
jgi:hypothetical protein